VSHLLFQILPLACGAAISPTLLIIAVLSLSSPVHPLKSGWAVAAGSFNITFRTTGGTTTETPVFNFAVIKAVAA
jgi:hypothetical protein